MDHLPLSKYMLVWLLGAGGQSITFATYNAVDYYNHFFPYYDPLFYFGLALAVCLPLGVGSSLVYKPKNHKSLIFFYSGMGISVTIGCAVCSLIGFGKIDQKLGFALVTIFLCVAALLQAVCDGILYDFLGKSFPPKAIQAVQSGGTICFVLTFVVRVVAKLIAPRTDDGFVYSGFIYFGFIVLVQIMCALTIATLKPMKIELSESQPLINAEPVKHTRQPSFFAVARQMWPLMIFLGGIIICTHSIYPGLTSVYHSGSGPASSGWFVVILFGCFSVGDFVGKNLPLVKKLYNHKTVFIGLALHFCLFGLAIMGMQHKVAPHFFDSDIYAYVLLAVLGVSNGFIMVCGYMSLPEVLTEESRGVGSSAALFSVYLGLFVGTLCSIGINAILVKTHFTEQ